MSKDRFFELLNLYIDNELDAEGEKEFIAAVESNDEFRRSFTEYRMMSQACTLLPDNYPLKRAGMGTMQMIYAFGGLAAALAFVFIGIQNASPLWNSQVVERGGSEFAVYDESSTSIYMEEKSDFGGSLETVSVSFGNSSLKTGLGSKADSPTSWRNGLLDGSGSRRSLDHELQLSLEFENNGLVFGKDRTFQQLDSTGFSVLKGHNISEKQSLSFESLLSPEFTSNLAK